MSDGRSHPARITFWAQGLGVALAFAAVVTIAAAGDGAALARGEFWASLLLSVDVWPYVAAIIILSLLVVLAPKSEPRRVSSPTARQRVALSLAFGVAAFFIAAGFGWKYRHLPPAYHDEFSYLLQAQTFLSGRVSWPPPPAHEHFDQMHVLNDGNIIASRYFPATGLWIAPFLVMGAPYLAGWIAQGLVAGFATSVASRQSLSAGIVTGSLIATSPGMLVFANTFLSPHPTMLGLVIGWWAYAAARNRSSSLFAFIGGLAMGWAFLARPVTAAAIGFPWVVYALWQAYRGNATDRKILLALVLGFTPAVLKLAAFNHAITGNSFVTPYGHYTAVYSPSHVYGFYNRTRGERDNSERTMEEYDAWAPELTPRLALEVTAARWRTALPWMAGLLPLIALLSMYVLQVHRFGDPGLLLLLSLWCLTLAYLPFGFEGILGWSYLAEATPILLIIAGGAASAAAQTWRSTGHALAAGWLIVISLIPAGISLIATSPGAFSPASEVVYPRIALNERLERERQLTTSGPVLVLYDEALRKEIHTTWVFHSPRFDDLVVRGWALNDPLKASRAFPDRKAYLCEKQRGQLVWRPLPNSSRP